MVATHRVIRPSVLYVGKPEAIERWEVAGGTWQVLFSNEDRAAVELLRCDGGEVVEVLSLSDEREVRWAAVQTAMGRK